jgi:hypothetical protein
MTFYEYLARMPQYKEKCILYEDIILDIFNTSEVVTWSSFMRNGKHKLLPCRCGITYRLMPAEQFDEISIINKYFQKLYTIEKKTHELEKDFE